VSSERDVLRKQGYVFDDENGFLSSFNRYWGELSWIQWMSINSNEKILAMLSIVEIGWSLLANGTMKTLYMCLNPPCLVVAWSSNFMADIRLLMRQKLPGN
jgi:hypothetical protein